ncbi:conserved hypothetical protein [Nautilia profundicola AmH]|uniref:Uncharacterized protein n=1 Tax=Nautilia profundicola (strain ATCC BAA-1463 / DSM 18972 / AmH) TaxID=598659 RepID=B9L8E9_NAUPA|nr:hypothetical protein [Nautilia profundicola]ACM93027.1 conserved hypothetical protein [Nautilia profundicola AmH]
MKSYLNELKVAVINKDLKKLEQVVQMQPVFDTMDEAMEIQAFMQQAIDLLQDEKNRLTKEMQKIKNLQKFNNEQSKETFNFKA